MRIAAALIFGVTLAISAPAFAIYKCKSQVDGATAYSDQPCEGATALQVPNAPAADSKDRARHATQEMNTLKRLERERHKREAADARERRSGARSGSAQRKKCASFARRQKQADEKVASSAGKANDKAKLKARQLRDDYEAACGRWPERELVLAR